MIFHAGALLSNALFLQGGYIGVDIFFVLSGFLITALLTKEYNHTSHINFRKFYFRRLLRLAPALLLLLSVYLILSLWLSDNEKIISNDIDALITLCYMSNWARAFSIHPPDFLAHTWSLSLEEQFYLLWPFILLLLLRFIKNRWHIVGLIFVFAVLAFALRIYLFHQGVSVHRLYNGLDTRADALMVGCALGVMVSSKLLNQHLQLILSKILLILSPLALANLAATAIYMKWTNAYMYQFGFFCVSLSAGVIILDILLNQHHRIYMFLNGKLIVWIGMISYGLYLWHFPIFKLWVYWGFHGLIAVISAFIVTFIISALSYYILERPILKYKSTHQT